MYDANGEIHAAHSLGMRVSEGVFALKSELFR